MSPYYWYYLIIQILYWQTIVIVIVLVKPQYYDPQKMEYCVNFPSNKSSNGIE